PTYISHLSLHDALPISGAAEGSRAARPALRHGADRREAGALRADGIEPAQADRGAARARARLQRARLLLRRAQHAAGRGEKADRDRKSTRLNSSHEWIS